MYRSISFQPGRIASRRSSSAIHLPEGLLQRQDKKTIRCVAGNDIAGREERVHAPEAFERSGIVTRKRVKKRDFRYFLIRQVVELEYAHAGSVVRLKYAIPEYVKIVID